MKIKTNIDTKESYEEMVKYITNFINKNEEVIIMNIGTDRSTGDSLAPLVGTMLEENECSLKVYGTIEHPIHAQNLNDRLLEIKELHPNAKIIGIDASLGQVSSIGNIVLEDTSIQPGAALGKELPQVGDISIAGIIGVSGGMSFMILQNTRLFIVYKMAKMISNIIMESCGVSQKNKTIDESVNKCSNKYSEVLNKLAE